ncbi:MAG: hypothetical protein ACRCX2_27060, partial [Paraclostridium sp.]
MDNFYNDHMFDKKQLTVLKKAMQGSVDIMQSQLSYTERLGTVSSLPSYRVIPIYNINMSSALYDLKDVFSRDFTHTSITINNDMSLGEKYAVWHKSSVAQKIDALDMFGIYVGLTSGEYNAENNTSVFNGRTSIESLEIYDSKGNCLISNIDYALKNNKIYLLREYNASESMLKKDCVLKNIIIDSKSSEDILGDALDIHYDSNLAKTDYTEILKLFTKSALKGPTLHSLRQSLQGYTTLSGIDVYDYKSAKNAKKEIWSELHGLSRFDFIIAIPARIFVHRDKITYIEKFFNKIRPSFANYVFLPEELIDDKLPLKKASHLLAMDMILNNKEKLRADDTGISRNVFMGSYDKVNVNNVFKIGDKYHYLYDKGTKMDSAILASFSDFKAIQKISDKFKQGKDNMDVTLTHELTDYQDIDSLTELSVSTYFHDKEIHSDDDIRIVIN